MDKYFEEENVKKEFRDVGKYLLSEDDIADLMESIPVADVAPVVHGRWETNADPGEEIKDFHCSVCDYLLCDIDTACMIPGQNDFYFCPSCGAKMDLEE